MAAPVFPPIGDNIKQWGENFKIYLQRQLPRLYFKTASDNPSENGIVLWDEVSKYAVVSSDGAFRQLATKQPVPSASTGSLGDVTGMISWDTSYIYICTADYNGSSAIWKRVGLSTW
jgi:hypothetical protein